MPPILSCIVAKRLCTEPTENHWALRQFAATLVASICIKFGNSYQTLQPRVTRTLLRAFLDPAKPLTTHYGAIIGLSKLGPDVIKALVIPNIKIYVPMLIPIIEDTDSANTLRRAEAMKCMEALEVNRQQ